MVHLLPSSGSKTETDSERTRGNCKLLLFFIEWKLHSLSVSFFELCYRFNDLVVNASYAF